MSTRPRKMEASKTSAAPAKAVPIVQLKELPRPAGQTPVGVAPPESSSAPGAAKPAVVTKPKPLAPAEPPKTPEAPAVSIAAKPEPAPAEVAPPGDAESVPSLRALVVASPVADDEPSRQETPTLGEPVPHAPRAEPEAPRAEASVALRARGRHGWKVGALVALAAAAVLYFKASEPRGQIDALARAPASEAMAMPLEEPEAPAASPAATAGAEPGVGPATNEAPAPAAGESEPVSPASLPSETQERAVPYDAQHLAFALRWARKEALLCHQGGRAGGTVSVAITFAPEGKVSDVVLSGEPIASAPVAGCISSYFKAMLIPAYDGQPFTIREELTLR